MIVLIGFMGAGKTTVGREVALRLGLPFKDTDALIESRAGRTIAELFEERGERAFRELEREVAAEVLAGEDAVVALGGGAVMDPNTAATVGWYDVFYLETPYSEAMRRIGADPGRPMLDAVDPRALYESRRTTYEGLGKHRMLTSGRESSDLADEIVRTVSPQSVDDHRRRIRVALGPRSYDVVVGTGLLPEIGNIVSLEHAEIAFVVTHPRLERYVAEIVASLKQAGLAVWVEYVPSGEATKNLKVVERLYENLAEAGAHRNDVVVSVGGGVVGDLAGFVAATYHRGTRLLHVPTTLLAQVDAAIGGKTGVNLPHGKNLVGSIHQPIAVVCDVEVLDSLPYNELSSGMAEVVKYGFVADPSILKTAVEGWDAITSGETEVISDVVARSAAIKAEIVSGDEGELGGRAVLNYGHTFGHAIERVKGPGRIRHGEAVALGMMAAAYLAEEMKMIDADAVEEHRRVLSTFGLPVTDDLDLTDLERAWRHDKKYRGGVRFVLLSEIGRARYGIEAPPEALARAVERLRS